MSCRHKLVAIIAVFTLAASTLVPWTAGAAQSKGGKAESRMSDKGRANTNAQWMADPEKGWVRAEERHRLRDKQQESPKENGGKLKGKAQKKN